MITASTVNTRRGSLRRYAVLLVIHGELKFRRIQSRKAWFRRPKNEQELLLHKSPQLYVPDVDRKQQGVDAPSNDANATL